MTSPQKHVPSSPQKRPPAIKEKTNWTWRIALVIAIGVIAIFVALLLNWRRGLVSNTVKTPRRLPLPLVKPKPVAVNKTTPPTAQTQQQIKIYDNFDGDWAQLVRDRTPFVLRRPSALRDWRAFNRWRSMPFNNKSRRTFVYNSVPDLGAYFDESKPAFSGVRPKPPMLYELVNTSFFDLRRSGVGYWVFSQHVNQLIGSEHLELAGDIQPIDVLLLGNPQVDNSFNVNVWVSSPLVHTHAHYDGYDNFNVQIVGKKRWCLVRDAFACVRLC
jgi:hypothetical protein